MKHCNKCGREVSDSSIFCKHCGHKIKTKVDSSAKSFCNNCGKEISSDALFCKYCGEKLIHESTKEDFNNKTEDSKSKKYYCEHCGREFSSEIECLKHEKGCKSVETSNTEKIIIHQRPKGLRWIFFLIILLVIGAVIFIANQGTVQQFATIDPCQRNLDSCNHDCGEGILSSICKEKCTYDYNQCKRK